MKRLTLTLFMARILTDDKQHAAPLDEFTLITDPLHASTNFHNALSAPPNDSKHINIGESGLGVQGGLVFFRSTRKDAGK